MNDPRLDPDLKAAFEEMGQELGGPEPQWQSRVLARIAREPERVRLARSLWIWRMSTAALAVVLVGVAVPQFVLGRGEPGAVLQSLPATRAEVAPLMNRELDDLHAARDKLAEALRRAQVEARGDAESQARFARCEKELAEHRRRIAERRRALEKRLRKVSEPVDKARVAKPSVACEPADPLCGI